MNTIPPINELSIRRFAGEKNYADGKKNFRNGLLHNLHKQGMMLKGDYSGLDGRLAMKVTFDIRGPTSATCTCGNRGQCKHIAALLVAWQQQPSLDFKTSSDAGRLITAPASCTIAFFQIHAQSSSATCGCSSCFSNIPSLTSSTPSLPAARRPMLRRLGS